MNSIGRNKAWRIAANAAQKLGLDPTKARHHELILTAALSTSDNQYEFSLKHEDQIRILPDIVEGLLDRDSFIAVGMALGILPVEISGGNLLVLLILTAVTSFILGMGVGPTGCYVFLAIMVVPSLEAVGVPLIAAHLFVVYWALVSLITPPVALNCRL